MVAPSQPSIRVTQPLTHVKAVPAPVISIPVTCPWARHLSFELLHSPCNQADTLMCCRPLLLASVPQALAVLFTTNTVHNMLKQMMSVSSRMQSYVSSLCQSKHQRMVDHAEHLLTTSAQGHACKVSLCIASIYLV